MDRRIFLGSLGAAALFTTGRIGAQAFEVSPFQLGVASGDPAPDGFVIWTRLAPEPLDPHGGMPMRGIEVAWEVGHDADFRSVVRKGVAVARPELAHSVHVEVTGLLPGRPYWYRFRVGGERSLTGRAGTAPAPNAKVDRLRFGVAGCQHYEEGFFHAFRTLAEEPVDFIFHYGDYIYEYPAAPPLRMLNERPFTPVRHVVGGETYSLDDYRQRYAQAKLDPDLQAAHAAHPWFVTFDDHEVENNWAGDHDENGSPAPFFASRRAAALQAWYEHMPVRPAAFPVGGQSRMHRRARWGDLASLNFLDTRQYRSDQACGDGDKPSCPAMINPTRTMLGGDQERWLFDGLASDRARWNVLAQQVMMMTLDHRNGSGEKLISLDSWGGYPAARDRLLRHIRDRRLENVVVLTGDAHQHFAGDVTLLPGEAPVATEFLTTSATSGGDGVAERSNAKAMLARNAELKLMLDKRGYSICNVARATWTTEMKTFDAVSRSTAQLTTAASLVVEHGRAGIADKGLAGTG